MISEEERNRLYDEDVLLHGGDYIRILAIEEMAELIVEYASTFVETPGSPK